MCFSKIEENYDEAMRNYADLYRDVLQSDYDKDQLKLIIIKLIRENKVLTRNWKNSSRLVCQCIKLVVLLEDSVYDIMATVQKNIQRAKEITGNLIKVREFVNRTIDFLDVTDQLVSEFDTDDSKDFLRLQRRLHLNSIKQMRRIDHSSKTRQSSFKAGQSSVKAGQSSFKAGQSSVKAGQSSFKAGQSSFKALQSSIEAQQSSVEARHSRFFQKKSDMRGEIAIIRSWEPAVSSNVQNGEGQGSDRKRKFTASATIDSESQEAAKRCKVPEEQNDSQADQSETIDFEAIGGKQYAHYSGQKQTSQKELLAGDKARKSESVLGRRTSKRRQRRDGHEESSAADEFQTDQLLSKISLRKRRQRAGCQTEKDDQSSEESMSQNGSYLKSDMEYLHGKRLVIVLNDIIKNHATECDPILIKFKQSNPSLFAKRSEVISKNKISNINQSDNDLQEQLDGNSACGKDNCIEKGFDNSKPESIEEREPSVPPLLPGVDKVICGTPPGHHPDTDAVLDDSADESHNDQKHINRKRGTDTQTGNSPDSDGSECSYDIKKRGPHTPPGAPTKSDVEESESDASVTELGENEGVTHIDEEQSNTDSSFDVEEGEIPSSEVDNDGDECVDKVTSFANNLDKAKCNTGDANSDVCEEEDYVDVDIADSNGSNADDEDKTVKGQPETSGLVECDGEDSFEGQDSSENDSDSDSSVDEENHQ